MRSVVSFQGNIFKEHIFIHKNIYSFKELSSFLENILKEIIFKEMYSFKEIIFIQGNMFIQGNYAFNNVAFATIAEIFIQQASQATLW